MRILRICLIHLFLIFIVPCSFGTSVNTYLTDNYPMFVESGEKALRDKLFRNYSNDIRPVKDLSKTLYVNITLTIMQIVRLDEQNQVMTTSVQIKLMWIDELLSWDPKEHGNLQHLVVQSHQIWTPDIVLFNSADVAYSTQRDNFLIDVQYDGTTTWMFPDVLKSYCKVDIKYFPFDKQKCPLELQSWSRKKDEMIVFTPTDKAFNTYSYIKTEWNLINITVTNNEANNFVWLEYSLSLKRNHAFYLNHLIFPFTLLAFLTTFVFLLPPESGEKITLTITILLALTVFLQLITEYTPKAAKTLPLIGLYFNFNLILVLCSIILTILVLNFQFRGPKRQRVPRWMRTYLIGYLGRAVCFGSETRAFYLAHLTRKDNKKRRERKVSGDRLGTDAVKCSPTQFGKIPKNDSVYNILPETSNIPKSTGMKQSTDVVWVHNNSNNRYASHESSCRNLEKLVRKMNKTADMFDIEDKTLKVSILKEVLECQRLLLTNTLGNEKQPQDLQVSQDAVYDEWKLLAMVVDRVCFFLYLLALFTSSATFFFVDYYYNNAD